MGNPVFNAFFAGINIRSPNVAINIGFPTLIPMLIMFAFNLLSNFLTSFNDDGYNHQRNTNTGRGGSTGGSNTYSTRHSAVVEDDYSLPKFFLMLILCIGLPILVRRIMRSLN